jgi:uncharacterized membrane protein (DUF4010 family)
MFVRVIVLVAVVNRELLPYVVAPFGFMAVAIGAFAAWHYFHSDKKKGVPKGSLNVRNPFSLTAAAKFGALFAVVLLAVKIVQENFPPSGLYAIAALAGLTDVDAITLSMAEFAQGNAERVAVIAIVIAAVTNTLVKCGMAFAFAGRDFGKMLLAPTAVTLLGGLALAFML